MSDTTEPLATHEPPQHREDVRFRHGDVVSLSLYRTDHPPLS